MSQQQHLYRKQCPTCRRQCPIDQKTCDGCGRVFQTDFSNRTQPVPVAVAPTVQTVYCLRCRQQMTNDATFCPKCGWDQRQYPSQVPPPPSAPQQQSSPVHPIQPPQNSYHQPPPPYQQTYPQQYPVAGNRDDIQLAPGTHSAASALVLSLLVIGVGQMYNRQVVKGVVFLLLALASVPFTFFLLWLPIAILSSIDAYSIGKKLQQGRRVGQWESF